MTPTAQEAPVADSSAMLEKMAAALADCDGLLWPALLTEQQEPYRRAARAALLAIREPSAEMIDAAQCVGGRVSTFNRQAQPIFTAMIDSILEGKA